MCLLMGLRFEQNVFERIIRQILVPKNTHKPLLPRACEAGKLIFGFSQSVSYEKLIERKQSNSEVSLALATQLLEQRWLA